MHFLGHSTPGGSAVEVGGCPAHVRLIKTIFRATLFQQTEEYERVCVFLGLQCNSNVQIFDGAEDSDTVGQISVLF